MQFKVSITCVLTLVMCSCSPLKNDSESNFSDDVNFLQEHSDVVVLNTVGSSGKVAVVPSMQGRVMTSAVTEHGESYGWINYQAIASGERQKQINVFGGEDRFWLGPEGGAYSLFFEPGESQIFANWDTPPPVDWGKWSVVSQTPYSIAFQETFAITNHAGHSFSLEVTRTVRTLPRESVENNLGVSLSRTLQFVGYESENKIKNMGQSDWRPETGLLSIWILGMLKHSEKTVVAIPYIAGSESQLGPIVKDDYFGKVPSDRLLLDREKSVLYFKADGQMRTKIGLSPQRAKDISASYSPETNTLTIVQIVLPQSPMPYVNSQWTDDDASVDPYGGDVINSYNDGPNENGNVLGPFYELESSSPALSLASGQSGQHIHRTYHFHGERAELDDVAKALLDVSVDEISNAL